MKHVCNKCGYSWQSRIEGMPRQCPRCKSTQWSDAILKGPRLELLAIGEILQALHMACDLIAGMDGAAAHEVRKTLNKYNLSSVATAARKAGENELASG